MKKFFMLLVITALLTACESTPEVEASGYVANTPQYNVFKKQYGGMWYLIMNTGAMEGGLYAVNLTRDSLECELLKRNLLNQP